MTISNHFAVGALIAYVVRQPVLAIPLAFLSHFVLDALPHHGVPGENSLTELIQTKTFILMVSLDSVGLVLILSLLYRQPLLLAGGLAAASPDSVWIYRLFRHGKDNVAAASNRLTKFHASIQWGEREWGIFVELGVFAVLYTTLLKLV